MVEILCILTQMVESGGNNMAATAAHKKGRTNWHVPLLVCSYTIMEYLTDGFQHGGIDNVNIRAIE